MTKHHHIKMKPDKTGHAEGFITFHLEGGDVTVAYEARIGKFVDSLRIDMPTPETPPRKIGRETITRLTYAVPSTEARNLGSRVYDSPKKTDPPE
ncbi:MAG: hypothetical protein WC322_06435 [Candidatus Paceibacterota bacterium]|jgi:hypothetical protein